MLDKVIIDSLMKKDKYYCHCCVGV